MPSFYSRGKLLITGEYAVLDGAQALAVPAKKGQSLSFRSEPNDQTRIHWESFSPSGALWFEAHFDKNFGILYGSDREKALTLQKILLSVSLLNPDFLSQPADYRVTSKLEFNPDWGLGSSSTLINNMAQWAAVNPYRLLEMTFGGSGYDVACARSSEPLIYRKTNADPEVHAASFDPPFADELFFVYLNQKRNSREAVTAYRDLTHNRKEFAENISAFTRAFIACKRLDSFEQLLTEHEQITGSVLKQKPVKATLFPHYPGGVKSLGAWGGDFVLASRADALDYFPKKGFETVVPYKEMVCFDQ